jgi:hypothetical protein
LIERGTYEFGDTTIRYLVTRSKRRKKTVSIKLDPLEGVVIAVPQATSSEDVREFIRKRAGWIVRSTSKLVPPPRPKDFVSGESLPYLGRQVPMNVGPSKSRHTKVWFDQRTFHVEVSVSLTGDERQRKIRSAFEKWYKERAAEQLPVVVEKWTGRIGTGPKEILIRSQRRRWGSCASDGTIRFNWRVLMTEPALVEHVVVHEMLHLKHLNHSAAFWQEFKRIMPDYEIRKSRLNEVGQFLDL